MRAMRTSIQPATVVVRVHAFRVRKDLGVREVIVRVETDGVCVSPAESRESEA